MRYLFALVICINSAGATYAQRVTPINDLSAFKEPAKTWRTVGAITTDLEKPNVFEVTEGSGILVNQPDKKNKGADIFTTAEFGDMDVELDYMMAKGSNSGIYLHGRYEVQLMDSWNLKSPAAGTNGGIYQRWDERRPEGQKGYEGHAPRQNASRAPGLWQNLKISFQAPRFDASGKKVSAAQILRVELNGVIIHENVELSGPTRGAVGEEKATGPLRIQGDHGAVAFRNIRITDFGQSRPVEAEKGRRSRVYPILVEATSTPVFRSFMDLPGGKRIVHAVSVGSPAHVHYTYDTDKGAIVQVWRGGFLDATPMWYSRGDGSSRPMGALQRFGDPALSVAKLSSKESPWISDTVGTGFRPLGYQLDANENPVFIYRVNGSQVKDAVYALASGEGIVREVSITGPLQNLYFRLADAPDITLIKEGLYKVGDHAYYLKVESPGTGKPFVRNSNGRKELLVPVSGQLKYTILF